MWKLRFTTRTYIVALGILFLLSTLFTPTPTPAKSRIPRHYHPVEKSNTANEISTPRTPRRDDNDDTAVKFKENMKNILIWSGNTPFQLVQPGEDSFVIDECVDSNCFVTRNKSYLRDLRKFDAIIFGAESLNTTLLSLPKVRSLKQKYIFTSLNPASMLPVSNPVYDNFFNWTWTYRLSSDIPWRLFTITDTEMQNIFGPAIDMHWPKNLGSVEPINLPILKGKTRAAVWFASECITNSRREDFIKNLMAELSVYGLFVDVYGKCGPYHCDLTSPVCLEQLEKLYYFYFSFEKFIDEDYVTKDILIPLQATILPVVYGGANYSRFLPPNSYLNARELGPKKLAEVMNKMIMNSSLYSEYFKWTHYFKYEESDPDLCNFCYALNDEDMIKNITVYEKFRHWWKGDVVPNSTDRLSLPKHNFTQPYSVGFFDAESDENDLNAENDSLSNPSDSINYLNVDSTTSTTFFDSDTINLINTSNII